LQGVLSCHVPPSDVVQASIIRFSDNRVDGPHVFVPPQTQHVIDNAFRDIPNAQGVCQQDGSLDLAELVHLSGADKFAETIADVRRCRDFFLEEISIMGKDGSHAGSNAITLHNRHMSDAHTRDICDRVEFPRAKDADLNAEITEAQSSIRLGLGYRRGEGQYE
jgi:hypothetical protein